VYPTRVGLVAASGTAAHLPYAAGPSTGPTPTPTPEGRRQVSTVRLVAAAGGAVTALFLVVLTVSIVNAALPAIRTEKLR
jgi:Na+/melibiose symporter-like transporter